MINVPLIVEEYLNKLAPQYQTQKNFDFMRIIVNFIVAGLNTNDLEKFLDIAEAEGKWLDVLGSIVGAFRTDLYIPNFTPENIDVNIDNVLGEVLIDNEEGFIFENVESAFSTDEFYKTYIKLKIILNYSKASKYFIALFFQTLFGNDVYVSFQTSAKPLSLIVYAKDNYFEFIKTLAIRNLLPIPLVFDITVIKQPPEGYYYYSTFAIPFADVINGKISLTKYNEFRIANARYTYNNDGKTIFLPNGNLFKI